MDFNLYFDSWLMSRGQFEAEKVMQEAAAQSAKIRLEVPVPEDCDLATDAIESINGEATIYESESSECEKKNYTMFANKGTDTIEMKKPMRRTIVSIGDSEMADDMVNALGRAVIAGGSSVVKSRAYRMQIP